MVRHALRFSLLAILLMAVPASSQGTGSAGAKSDAGTASVDGGTSGKDGGTATGKQDKGSGSASAGGGRCTGKATFCGVYSSVFCSSQPGCSYHYATSTCGGLPPKCETATNQAFCKKIKGCSWK